MPEDDIVAAERMGMVSFIGAGPGDPELLTVKGRRLISEAALVLYAGSLVPAAVVACAGHGVPCIDSAPMTLTECHALVRETVFQGGDVARVHTGDPSLFGALREQTALLEKDGIRWQVVPGVTAACAAAAAAGVSFSVPEITQSLIITRQEGRTPMPERERIALLASHGTSVAVYLSGKHAAALQAELLSGGVAPETPVLCARQVGWPSQALVWTTVEKLSACVEANAMTRQTVFLILPGEARRGAPSRLYDPSFSHACRQAADEAPK